jgi:hypothetical protein
MWRIHWPDGSVSDCESHRLIARSFGDAAAPIFFELKGVHFAWWDRIEVAHEIS